LPRYCDVSLPVPLDQAFTYSLPLTLQHRVKAGARVVVPFGTRKLTGVALSVHDDPPGVAMKDVFRLIDNEPVLSDELLSLGRWISGYYCAPLGEVLRSMLPLAAEIRSGKIYSLTDAGRDASKQLSIDASNDDALNQVMQMLASRSLSAAHLKRKVPLADKVLKSLERKGWIAVEQVQVARDPLRAPSAKLRIELTGAEPAGKLPKAERELLAYLSLHPGTHNLGELEDLVQNASTAARALARRKLVTLTPEPMVISSAPIRAPHDLNPSQRNAFELIAAGIASHKFCTFLLHGVTGSGKTEVYLNAIDVALALRPQRCCWCRRSRLRPRGGAVLFAVRRPRGDPAQRLQRFRARRSVARIRAGGASVVVGTRSGVFAPVRNLGLIVVDEEHDGSYKQEENPRYNGRDVAVVRAQAAGMRGAGLRDAEPGEPVQCFVGQVHAAGTAGPHAERPMPKVHIVDMRQEFLETRKHATFSRALIEAIRERLQ
jgi:primosomal protein N' (replication factor Y)